MRSQHKLVFCPVECSEAAFLWGLNWKQREGPVQNVLSVYHFILGAPCYWGAPKQPLSVCRIYCYLLMRVNVDVALDTFLSHVGPGVPAHPLPLAFRAFIFPKTPLLSLVRGQALTFGSSLNKNTEQKTVLTLLTLCATRLKRPLETLKNETFQQLCKLFGFYISPPFTGGYLLTYLVSLDGSQFKALRD